MSGGRSVVREGSPTLLQRERTPTVGWGYHKESRSQRREEGVWGQTPTRGVHRGQRGVRVRTVTGSGTEGTRGRRGGGGRRRSTGDLGRPGDSSGRSSIVSTVS